MLALPLLSVKASGPLGKIAVAPSRGAEKNFRVEILTDLVDEFDGFAEGNGEMFGEDGTRRFGVALDQRICTRGSFEHGRGTALNIGDELADLLGRTCGVRADSRVHFWRELG